MVPFVHDADGLPSDSLCPRYHWVIPFKEAAGDRERRSWLDQSLVQPPGLIKIETVQGDAVQDRMSSRGPFW